MDYRKKEIIIQGLNCSVSLIPSLSESALVQSVIHSCVSMLLGEIENFQSTMHLMLELQEDPVTFLDLLVVSSIAITENLPSNKLFFGLKDSASWIVFDPIKGKKMTLSQKIQEDKARMDNEKAKQIKQCLLDKLHEWESFIGEDSLTNKIRKIGSRECPTHPYLDSSLFLLSEKYRKILFDSIIESVNQVIIPKESSLNPQKNLNNLNQWNYMEFRSKSEIKIAEELERAGVLFYANARCRLNTPKGRKTRESDFLVCQEGRWGILECDGEEWHQSAAKDHQRDDWFNGHGVWFIKRYSATECFNNPSKVTVSFLTRMREFYDLCS